AEDTEDTEEDSCSFGIRLPRPPRPLRLIPEEDRVETWRTAITNADGNRIIVRGHDLVDLMQHGTYPDVVALLLGGHRPDEGERRLIDSILIAVADHGAGSPSAATARMAATGNRQAPEAVIAAGILAIGDAHAGAGMACMLIINDALARATRESR